jgi:hypothetical protein
VFASPLAACEEVPASNRPIIQTSVGYLDSTDFLVDASLFLVQVDSMILFAANSKIIKSGMSEPYDSNNSPTLAVVIYSIFVRANRHFRLGLLPGLFAMNNFLDLPFCTHF